MTASDKPASNGSTRRISATTSRDGLAKLRRGETVHWSAWPWRPCTRPQRCPRLHTLI